MNYATRGVVEPHKHLREFCEKEDRKTDSSCWTRVAHGNAPSQCKCKKTNFIKEGRSGLKFFKK